MTERLSTGIDLLDRKLGGGLPVGSLGALAAPPASQSELFLAELATERPTTYVTPLRSADSVSDTFVRLERSHPDLTVAEPDGDDVLEATLALADDLPAPATLVVDPADPYERCSPDRYAGFLNALRDRLADRGAFAVLHCLDGGEEPPARRTTEYMVDVVFEMVTERSGEQLETSLTVPKFRGGRAVDDVIKLSLTTDVDVDISRNIV